MKINKIIVFFVSLIFLWPSVTICAKIELKKNIKEKANIEKDIQEKVGIKTFDEKKSRIGNTYQVHIKKVDSLVVDFTFSSEPCSKNDIILKEDANFIILDLLEEMYQGSGSNNQQCYKVLLDPEGEKITGYIGTEDLRINLENIKDVILKSEINDEDRQKLISENERKRMIEKQKEKLIAGEKEKESQKKLKQDEKDYIKKLKAKRPPWSDRTIQHILKGSIHIGMTTDQAIESWGKPEKINTTITANVIHEQWVYDYRGIYLYFVNGVLTAIQN